eukprot:15186021-Alexandrium_andersonii.AAC.1
MGIPRLLADDVLLLLCTGALAQGCAFVCFKALLAYVVLIGGQVSASDDCSWKSFVFGTLGTSELLGRVRWSPLAGGP